MSGIAKSITKLIQDSPFLEEAIADKLINVSSLARKLQPELSELLGREVSEGSIIMAINRMEPSYYYKINKRIKRFLGSLGDYTVKSNINDYTFKNSDTLFDSQAKFLKEVANKTDAFLSISNGIKECTLIASADLHDTLLTYFERELLIGHKKELAAVTINLPKDNTEVSGIYYYILKRLAWLGINIIEVVSTTNEITFLVSENDIDRTFSALMNLKRGN